MVPVGARLTDWWPLSPLGVLFHTTRSSSEDWGPLTDGDSDLLTLPTIRFLALLITCWLLFSNQPSVIQLWSILLFEHDLDPLVSWQDQPYPDFCISYLGLCFSQQSIIYHQLHCDTGWSLSLEYNLNIFPSQARASATPTILNWGDLKSFVIFIKPTCFENICQSPY